MCVDVPHAHLDHPFSYRVPEALQDQVLPGTKVKVPFAAADVDAWVLEVADADVAGLKDVRRVVTGLPVLPAPVAAVARRVADHYAGTLADVLRTAVPPRHARGERAAVAAAAAAAERPPAAGERTPSQQLSAAEGASAPDAQTARQPGWETVVGGKALLSHLTAGRSPCAVVRLPLAVEPWAALADLAACTVAAGRRALLVVPDVADTGRLAAACRSLLTVPGQVAELHSGLGPERRWRTHCEVLAGLPDVVVGTRAAAFAPVPVLGLVAVWDDGDDAHVEPHAPGWQSLLVARFRAEEADAALAVVSHSRSVQAQHLVVDGGLVDLAPPRSVRRSLAPRVVVPDPDDPLDAAARLPRAAHRVVAEGLAAGPVLLSVPRRGYVPSLLCQRCRAPARCTRCPGRLLLGGPGPGGDVATGPGAAGPVAGASVTCAWCGTDHTPWSCPHCRGTVLRASVVGVHRSAEELGRVFAAALAGKPVVTSHGGQRVHDLDARPRLVLATPGAEPVAQGGYAAAVLLDTDAVLGRPGLQVVEESVRRWLHVGSLVRPAPSGGRLVVVGDPGATAVQALVRDAPEELAARLLVERTDAGLPPAGTIAAVCGDTVAVLAAAARIRGEDRLAVDAGTAAPGHAPGVLGPVGAQEGSSRLLVTGSHAAVTAAVREVLEHRSARRAPGRLRVRIDPVDLD